MNKFFISFLLFWIPITLFSTNYYVSNSGNDNNDGLSDQTAWKTLNKVNDKSNTFIAGDIIAFKGGDEFYGKLYFWNINGTVENPITFTSYGTGRAIFKGTEIIKNWAAHSGNIYVADASSYENVYHVLANNKTQINGRLPNLVGKYATSDNYYSISSAVNSRKFICSDLIGLPDLTGATVHIQGQLWTLEARQITSFNNATGEVTIDSSINSSLSVGDQFFINNHISLLSNQNEWFYDLGNKKLYLFSATAPTNISLITLKDNNLTIDNSSYVLIDNLHILGGDEIGISILDSNEITLQNNIVDYIRKYGIHSYNSPKCKVINNKIEKITWAGISLAGNNSLIENNYISDIGLLENFSHLGNGDKEDLTGALISYKPSTIIRYNKVEDVGYNGIEPYGVNTIAQYNFIKNSCLTGHDGGAIYTFYSNIYPSTNMQIIDNIVVNEIDLGENWSSHGIYCDDNSKDLFVAGNSVSGFALNMFSHNNKRNKFDKNTLFNSVGEGMLVKNDHFGNQAESNIVTNNEIYLEKDDETPLRVQNSIQSTYDIASYEGNKYYNPINVKTVKVLTKSASKLYSLSEWKSVSGEDASSVEDNLLNWSNGGKSQFVYNETKSSKTFTLDGNWWDLSGNKYNGSITLESYKSAILVNQEVFFEVTVIANAGADVSICKGDSATLIASGGSTYSWSTGETTKSITVNPNSTTTYTVTVLEESGLSDTDDVKVTVNELPIADAGLDKTIESGQSVILTASGGSSYSWSTGATTQTITVSPQETTIYNVIVANNNGCENTDSVEVVVNEDGIAPADAFAGNDVSICLGESLTLTASGGDTYVWSTGDTNKNINISPTRTTTYTLSATRGGTTDTDTVVVTVENCSAVSGENKQKKFVVYPNPTSGNINISAKNVKEDFTVFVSDSKGSIVYFEQIHTEQGDFFKKIDLSRFEKGTYFIGFKSSNIDEVEKIIIYK